MYLKNIEIQGFKSFANKIQFKFDQGITGIVGPNGSGKSNVADAVRWVLGEQSAKQLRGSKMEDVIFAGTENRRPLGFCYVSLTIENSDKRIPIDYTEVTVARKVYRSGESEYSINGSVCRLKDIQELFFDTGVGKEGYSIIGQGQIDKILSSKPEDRRDLFDEAAGIVKFKKRKAVAEKKLEEEKQNIDRIDDILLEIENQLEPLSKQAETAKEYLKYKEELKKYEINLFLHQTDKSKDQLNELIEKEEIVNQDLNKTKLDLSEIKQEYGKIEVKVDELTKIIDESKEEMVHIHITKEKTESQINIIKEQISALDQSNNITDEQINNVNVRLVDNTKLEDEYRAKKMSIDNDVFEKDEELRKLEEAINSITEKVSKQLSSIEIAKANILSGQEEISLINSNLQKHKTMIEQMNIRKSELNQKLLQVSSEESQRIFEKKDVDNKCKLVEENLQEVKKEKESLVVLNEKANEYQVNLIAELDLEQKKYHQNKSKYDALKDIKDHYEGYNFSIRKVMEYKQKNENIKNEVIGVVADIIKVEKKYETAIEIALGFNVQNVITTNEIIAKNIINYLKVNKLGRATFLPMTSIKGKTTYTNKDIQKEDGYIGVGSELVSCDNRFDGIIQNLLGRVIIIDNIDNAIRIANKYNHTVRLVTLSGEIINPGGSLTGGSFKNNNNFLGRSREIEEIEKALSQLVISIEEKKTKSELAKIEIKNYLEKINVVGEKIKDIELQQNTLKLSLHQKESELHQLDEKKKEIKNELLQIGIKIKENQLEHSKLDSKLLDYKDQNSIYENEIRELEELIKDDKYKLDEQQEEVTNLRIQKSNLIQESSYINESLDRITNDNNKLNQELKILKERVEENISSIEEKQKNILVCEKQIEDSQNIANDLEINLDNVIKTKDEKSNKLKEYLNTREELTNKINDLEKEIYRFSNQKEKHEQQITQLIDYMWDEYELTYNHALALKVNELSSINEMKTNISKIKGTIKELGVVNVNAIEDYKNITERHFFLNSQREDLLLAEEKLLDIIVELDEAMRIQFADKFKKINEEFNRVFKSLFGGGKGILELTSEEDILESGIKITAQPPGKKLQNMLLLSGGERAFTAISLLFAIQSLKPSPFCVLDEIEAALDDANVYRFAEYLQTLSRETQFIVITHRKGTMESADALYGITMQEKGISTLVSVNLIENEIEQ